MNEFAVASGGKRTFLFVGVHFKLPIIFNLVLSSLQTWLFCLYNNAQWGNISLLLINNNQWLIYLKLCQCNCLGDGNSLLRISWLITHVKKIDRKTTRQRNSDINIIFGRSYQSLSWIQKTVDHTYSSSSLFSRHQTPKNLFRGSRQVFSAVCSLSAWGKID